MHDCVVFMWSSTFVKLEAYGGGVWELRKKTSTEMEAAEK